MYMDNDDPCMTTNNDSDVAKNKGYVVNEFDVVHEFYAIMRCMRIIMIRA